MLCLRIFFLKVVILTVLVLVDLATPVAERGNSKCGLILDQWEILNVAGKRNESVKKPQKMLKGIDEQHFCG